MINISDSVMSLSLISQNNALDYILLMGTSDITLIDMPIFIILNYTTFYTY